MSTATRMAMMAALALSTPLHARDAETRDFKQLSGPPSEFAHMRAPDPAAAAILSKSALLPVRFGRDGRWQSTLAVAGGALRFALLSGGAAWDIELVSPSGVALSRADLQRAVRGLRLGSDGASQPADVVRLQGLKDGDWTLRLGGDAGTRGYLLLEGDARSELASHPVHRRQLVGESIGFVAQLVATDASGGARMGPAAGRVDAAALRVVAPDGSERTVAMADDGRHDDGAAGDGRYGAAFTALAAGSHIAQVVVHGRDARGSRVVRTAEHVVPVIRSTLQLGGAASAVPGAAGRLDVAIPLARDDGNRRYRVHAEVWGRDARGAARAVAWIGGMAEAADARLMLGLDTRWLARAGAGAPFELHDVRIEDADEFIPVAAVARIPLSMPAAFAGARPAQAGVAIDEAMTMGRRPRELTAQATGSRLVLVHGYCSAGVWPQAQFATASTFLDVNQNRSHDQFAHRLKTFGAQWNSFGTVAHSQGGAAALHLYTYYWSGLDNATGSRLMQSVGTPYQGTNLSGILATVGNWFGVACGSNANMTYSGASAWLAGIPAASRAKVNYHSTSFRSTNWWTNDYCNIASDLVLGDPEDGTVEKAYAQLPGAVNRGHAEGQCHTAGMRDPAQYNDAGRNATMSANAAR
ncbi:MAG TPA: choice-of-anchor X domain-containing protein [Luteimonas sp.]|nr:choice-of-anchor X domain-containing protein [Luteimonas sp.]